MSDSNHLGNNNHQNNGHEIVRTNGVIVGDYIEGRFKPGTPIMLVVPENTRLHGKEAIVKRVMGWGCYVDCLAASSGEFRALFSEMVLVGDSWPEQIQTLPVYNKKTAVEYGYTGSPCDVCGSIRMKRTGPCATCEDCGSGGGC